MAPVGRPQTLQTDNRRTHRDNGTQDIYVAAVSLKNRRNIVISTSLADIDGAEVAHSVEEAVALCRTEDEVFIIGGASVYEQTIGIADKIYLTRVLKDFEGDTFFPEIQDSRWQSLEKSEILFDEKEKTEFYYETLVRKQN